MSTKTYVSSAALHMIKTDENPIVAAAVAAILTESDLIETIISSSSGSLANKVGAVFSYAENEYALALPSGKTTQLNTPTKETIAAKIADDIVYPLGVIVTEFKYTTYQPYHEVLDYLVSERSFNIQSGNIYKYPGLNFNNGQVMYITNTAVSSDGLGIDMAYAYYGYQETSGYDGEGNPYTVVAWTNISNHTETIPRPDVSNTSYGDNCLMAFYVKLNSLGEMLPEKYVWKYRVYTNAYPALNNITSVTNNDKYFPVVPLRYNNVDLTAESLNETDLHKTSKRMLRLLDVSFESIGKQLNDSPDVASIDNAYIMFGANLQSNKPATLAYLNHYFDYLGTLGTTRYVTANPNVAFVDSPSLSFTEHGLSLAITFSSITTSYILGKIEKGIIGNARKSISYKTVYSSSVDSEGNTTQTSRVATELILDLQITASVLRRVIVTDLVMSNHVYPGYPVVTTLVDVKDDPEENNFIIPLEYSISLWLPYPDRTKLYTDCFLMILNSVERVKLKWYQETWFGALVMVVAFVIIVYTWQLWIGTLVGLTASAIVIAVIKAIIIGLIINMAMKWVVKKFGAKLGIIGGLILAIVALVASRGQAGKELLTQYSIQTAQLAMACSSALIAASNEAITASIQAVTAQYTAFSNLLKEAYEALETNTEVKALDFEAMYNPLAILRTKDYYEIPGEYAADFFERTLNLPYNTVYGVHEAIPKFVKNLLTVDNNTIMSTY